MHADFRHELDDVNAAPDYSDVIARYPKYRRSFRPGKRVKVPKTLEQQKEEHRNDLLRKTISDALGQPGMSPHRPTVIFEAIFASTNVFLDYVTSCRSEDGIGILKKMTYAGFRSSFTYLCRRYRQTPPIEFKEDLRELMVGVKRSCTEAAQHGEANLWDGERPLTWGLYKQFNKWFLQEDTEEGLFAAAFSKMTCVLACRIKKVPAKSSCSICYGPMIT